MINFNILLTSEELVYEMECYVKEHGSLVARNSCIVVIPNDKGYYDYEYYNRYGRLTPCNRHEAIKQLALKLKENG